MKLWFLIIRQLPCCCHVYKKTCEDQSSRVVSVYLAVVISAKSTLTTRKDQSSCVFLYVTTALL